ncbi:MAG TPA: four helix bundle protein [Calditrichia bacterium]|nr:four helix bundle protein [Calditrichota bacterium]HQU73652.1 four helix bundle protein [Calditrichia bacterium]HQV32193.1 four helix bundle protein [Calditrichia bacterium]
MLEKKHEDLEVYKIAMQLAMAIFHLTQTFPKEEKYALVDQMRRSSRSVAANLAEAWFKRRYKAAFVAKLNDCLSESCETQVWLEFAFLCQYLSEPQMKDLKEEYSRLQGKLIKMVNQADKWSSRRV